MAKPSMHRIITHGTAAESGAVKVPGLRKGYRLREAAMAQLADGPPARCTNLVSGDVCGEGGASLLELALLTPILLLLLAGSVDLGQVCYVAIELSAAASAGAEYGSQNPTDMTGMQRAVTLSATNLTGVSSTANWGCECSDGTSASLTCSANPTCATTRVKYVVVSASLNYVPVLGLPGLPTRYPLASTARLRAAE